MNTVGLQTPLRIDPEFQSKIPPLTDDEFKQLEENILEAGEVYEPITAWNGVIVDGHNRYRIVCAHPEIKWSTREMAFADKWAAFDWMFKNQLGRRNLTVKQRKYLLGKLYEARKKSHGNHAERGDDGRYLSAQNGHLGDERSVRQDEAIGKEFGVGHNTVRRAEKFAQGIDAIREIEPETADEILLGKRQADEKDVADIARAKEEERQQMIDELKERRNQSRQEANKEKPREMISGTKENRALNESIRASIAEMYDTEREVEYTFDMMMTVLRSGAERYVKSLRGDLENHKDLLEVQANRDAVADMIQETIINEIEKIKESIEK